MRSALFLCNYFASKWFFKLSNSKYMKYVFFFVALFVSANLMAQSVAVYKDPRIDVLLKKQAEVNNVSTRNKTSRRTARGYRLLVANTNNRTEAMAARTKILTYYPELKPYLTHQAPYFKVAAGNFLTRAEASAYQRRMSSVLPGAVIINATIEVKPEDVEDKD